MFFCADQIILIVHNLFRFSGIIDDKPLRFRGEVYHGYHFNCTSCGVELNSDARELKHRSGYTANEMVKYLIKIAYYYTFL